jgi:type II secretory pathway component GspD/PulD (secretin)
LGSLPVVGGLFRHSGVTRNKTNLVVYITPTVVTRDQVVDLNAELDQFNMRQKRSSGNKKTDDKKKTAIQTEINTESTIDTLDNSISTENKPVNENN